MVRKCGGVNFGRPVVRGALEHEGARRGRTSNRRGGQRGAYCTPHSFFRLNFVSLLKNTCISTVVQSHSSISTVVQSHSCVSTVVQSHSFVLAFEKHVVLVFIRYTYDGQNYCWW